MRDNLLRRLDQPDPLFPGIVGYDDSVVPQVANAILSLHNFVLLGLRGQAKTRLLRGLTALLDDVIAVIPGCQINDDPLAPLCRACRSRVAEEGNDLPIAWLPREQRLVEKLATPDVTIADMIGDVDPIKAMRAGLELSDELTMHYGLLPRANRGIFAVNELPDLAGKIQVGLFNILQEGDVQIKGYPIRLPLDVVMTFTANPEDYTARGKIITPLKDRIGSEIRTHYPQTLKAGMAITQQEAWTTRVDDGDAREAPQIPPYIREIVEEVAFVARGHTKIDKRSGVSQRMPITCLENALSNAERRALVNHEPMTVARIADIYAALPSITGKFELEYEGELKGADHVARDVIGTDVDHVFEGWFGAVDTSTVVEWFDLGGTLELGDTTAAVALLEQTGQIQGLHELATHAGATDDAPAPRLASAVEFIMEGLCAQKKISRSEDWQYRAVKRPPRKTTSAEQLFDADIRIPKGKKKYYN
ncbi:MAG: magnesium chelatase [Acidobacteriota bacterium]|nr:magnesium chelatase [Acidobacteriota bacterium]